LVGISPTTHLLVLCPEQNLVCYRTIVTKY
jgi:hypothetical protein